MYYAQFCSFATKHFQPSWLPTKPPLWVDLQFLEAKLVVKSMHYQTL